MLRYRPEEKPGVMIGLVSGRLQKVETQGSPEQISCHCRRCQYEWTVPPIDAATSPDDAEPAPEEFKEIDP